MKKIISLFLLLLLGWTSISGFTASAMEQPANPELLDAQIETSALWGIADTEKQLPFEFVASIIDGELLVEFVTDQNTSFSSIELSLFEHGSKDLLFSEKLGEGQTAVKFDNLEKDISYGFGVRYVTEKHANSVRGQLTINVENGHNGEAVASIDTLIDFVDENVPGENSILATVYEAESNDTSGTANPVANGDIVRGSISRVGDRDWFRVTFSGSGPANFSLSNIPSNCDYELCLYDSSVNLVGSSLTPGSVDEYISYNVTANRVYYIQVYSYQGISSSLYTLKINGPSQAHTWYSQVISEGGSFNWSRSRLDNLYFPNM